MRHFRILVCHVDGEARVQLEVFIDFQTDARLNAGKDELKHKLIIRIQGGEDLSVSFGSVTSQ